MNEEINEKMEASQENPGQTEREKTERPKADLLNRFLAKFLDFLVIAFLLTVIKAPVGSLAALTYSLISDGFFDGRSIGKKLIGLRVIKTSTGMSGSFRDSILRNIPIGMVVLFALIPILGLILLFTVGFVILLFEAYLIYTDDSGIRIGDIFADTQVVDAKES